MPWSRFRKKRDMPEGLWVKCPSCSKTLYSKELDENVHVCPGCEHHLRVGGLKRLETLLDPGSFQERWTDLHTIDRLGFVDKVPYKDKLRRAAKKSASHEAARAGTGTINGLPVAVCSLDFSFMGGSMGAVVGETVTRCVELGTAERLPVVLISCSGGARMHEGVLSLMQMGKTCAALARHHERGGLFISVLSNPTTGGVMASFAALGDLILAEPKALIGFAGPRVIQETLRIDLPKGFQTAEFLLDHGFIDRIVPRRGLRDELSRAICFLWSYEDDQLERWAPPAPVEKDEIPEAETKVEAPSGSGEKAEASEGATEAPAAKSADA